MPIQSNKIRNAVLGLAVSACGLSSQTGTLINKYTLPDTPIGPFQNTVPAPARTVAADRRSATNWTASNTSPSA